MRVAPNSTLPVARRLAAPLPQAPRPVVVAKARGVDPLPTFQHAEDYKNYVIKLVAESKVVAANLENARKRLNQGQGSQAAVNMQQEHLDAIKLQLAVLRDNYPIPGAWERPKWLFGEGFDQDAFWKAQVEVIPGKEVAVSPAPQPPKQPAAPPAAPVKPAPAPAAPEPAKAGFEDKLALADLAVKTSHYAKDQDAAVMLALQGALALAGSVNDCIRVIEKAESTSYYGNNQDARIKDAVNRAVELMRTPEEAIALAHAAEKYTYYANNQDACIKLALNAALPLNPSVDQALALAAAAESTTYYAKNQDELVTAALNHAIDHATTIAQCSAIMESAKANSYYANTQDAIVKKAMERANAL